MACAGSTRAWYGVPSAVSRWAGRAPARETARLGDMDRPSRLLYLDGPAVRAALPPVRDRLALAERALVSLAGEAQLPAKIGVHPRPDASCTTGIP